MENRLLTLSVIILLLLPISLLGQESTSVNESALDKAHFKAECYDVVKLFATNLYQSKDYIVLLTVTSDYDIDGVGDKSINDSIIINNWVVKNEAKNTQLLSEINLPPGNQIMDFLFENLRPNILITLRSLSEDRIAIRQYKMTY